MSQSMPCTSTRGSMLSSPPISRGCSAIGNTFISTRPFQQFRQTYSIDPRQLKICMGFEGDV
ncbi:hypothetical protein BDV98DRAFT_558693 [Pterulicium gracile]|uniref:Uncharacterized protein n=1 Tax=Pterulicium gracile TaxID=1884261 RepID=A0A5C3R3T0_9AGAR|nr:hypothetical protein BDV98DRAFT_558693 [Pterula gracilis]